MQADYRMTKAQLLTHKSIKVLVLEDDPADALLCVRKLMSSGMQIIPDIVNNPVLFKERILANAYDAVIGDFRLPDWNGIEAVRWMRQHGITLPFVLVTGTLGDDLAVECIKEGATDYVLKDKLERLPFVLTRALREQALQVERDEAERQLRQSERDYRSIIEGAPYGIYRADQEGNILMVNPALVQMLGYASEAEVLALNATRDIYYDPADRQRILNNIESPYHQGELRWKRKDGKQIAVRLAGRRLPGAVDALAQYEVFVENITERLTLERQFLQAQKMEAVGRLAGGVAHDFNNLLMVIRGCSELLEYYKDKPEKISGYVRQIYDATSSASSVVQQLLAFSRKQLPERQVLDLDVVLRDLLRMMPRLLGEDVEVTVRHGAAGSHHVNADRGNLEQIIMNLAINARDAMPGGGRLTIETDAIDVDERFAALREGAVAPGPYVIVTVTDTGVGMDPTTQAHLFEPFFTTKERGKGTGLGLSTVYGIVKQNGGFISVESTLGQGSTFRIYLPAVEAAVANEEPVVAEASPGGNETILLVEDEAALREITSEFLESKGYNVLSAANGASALEICKSYPEAIHLLLTDVIMPGIGGPELARLAHEVRPQMRTIYVSGYTDRTSDNTKLAENSVLLQKPYSLLDLSQRIRQVVTLPDAKKS